MSILTDNLTRYGVKDVFGMALTEVPDTMHVMLYKYGGRKRNDECNASMFSCRNEAMDSIGKGEIPEVSVDTYKHAAENLKAAKKAKDSDRIKACNAVLSDLLDKAFIRLFEKNQAGHKTFLETEFNEKLKRGEIGLKTRSAAREVTLREQATRIVLANWLIGQKVSESAAEAQAKKKDAWDEVTRRKLIIAATANGATEEEIIEIMPDLIESIPQWVPQIQESFKDQIDKKVEALEKIKKDSEKVQEPELEGFDLSMFKK